MPKRRRLLTPMKKAKQKQQIQVENEEIDFKVADGPDKEVSAARGRLMGALKDAVEPADESDTSYEPSPGKKEMQNKHDDREDSKEEDKVQKRKSPICHRQSYVLKLFDRSVDLSQFDENSPLYPICRAWMINQPKVNYKEYGNNNQSYDEVEQTEASVELPGPEGPPISRIPELLPEQKERSKDNININYTWSSPVPSREQLLRAHAARWAGVRLAWLERARLAEARYQRAQDLLNRINANAL